MSTVSDGKPPPPPATTAEAEMAALNAEILETGNANNGRIVEVAEEINGNAAKTKKAPQAGLNNYFVSGAYIWVGGEESVNLW